jgi:hypothetical protein
MRSNDVSERDRGGFERLQSNSKERPKLGTWKRTENVWVEFAGKLSSELDPKPVMWESGCRKACCHPGREYR